MKKYKEYFQWLNRKQKEKDPEHTTQHGEEVLKDTGATMASYMAGLKESVGQMSGTIDNYRNNKITEDDFKRSLRALKQNVTLVLMKLETGW